LGNKVIDIIDARL